MKPALASWEMILQEKQQSCTAAAMPRRPPVECLILLNASLNHTTSVNMLVH